MGLRRPRPPSPLPERTVSGWPSALPKWLSWAGVVLGVLFFTPVAFRIIFFVAPLWILIVSILGMRASGRESASVTT